jgi:hypothetical protein
MKRPRIWCPGAFSFRRSKAAIESRQCRGFEVRTIADIGLLADFETETTLETTDC